MNSMKDAHEYIPKRDKDFTGGMPTGYCAVFIMLPIIGLILAYLFQ